MNEIEKLEKYLKENGYNYLKTEYPVPAIFAPAKDLQIIVFDENNVRQWDAVCNFASYGHEKGLLEIMGTIARGDVEGWLTADDIIKRLEEGKA